MNIVVLDGGTTNPGDLSWAPLEALGTLTVYPDTPPELVLDRAQHAQAVIVNRVHLTREMIGALPELAYIGTLSIGVNQVDGAAARERGIPLCNVPFYCVDTVAQHALSLLLCLCGQVHAFSDTVRGGGWDDAVAMSHTTRPMVELSGKKLGILGYGHIGAKMAGFGQALGMEVLVYSRTKKEAPGCRWVSLEELFAESDVLSLHCPLTPETQGLVNRERLALMKPTALLINTARGGLIDEPSLAAALTGDEVLLDLYCGTGTIGLSMANRAKKLLGVEIIPQAVENAKENAARNHIHNARFLCGDAAQAAAELERQGERPHVVVIDPPRKGCSPELVKTIAAMTPRRVVYVSCDPATLARDLKLFAQLDYPPVEATPVDMFPGTAHVETVALLSRQAAEQRR